MSLTWYPIAMNIENLKKSERHEELGGEDGAVFVEYMVLIVTVTVIGAVATFSLGAPFLNMFRQAQAFLSLPIP